MSQTPDGERGQQLGPPKPGDPADPDHLADTADPVGLTDPDLGRTAVRGVATSLLGQLGRVVVQMAGVVVLARLLTPAEYGLIAMIMVIIGVGELFRDLGLSSAAVQAPTLTVAQRDALTWINTGIGVLLGALLAASGPLVARLYGEPLLAALCAVLALTFVANGAATQYRAGLMRDLRFRALAVIDVVSPAAALVVAIVLAAGGAGVWALAVQQVVAAFLMLVLVALVCRWLPGRPRRGADVRGFLTFGGHLVLSQLIGYVANNVDTFLVGYRFGKDPLGLYSRAFQLLMQPYNQVRTPVTRVALPVFSRLIHDPAAYQRHLVRGQLCLGYGLVLGLALVAACAHPLVAVMLGSTWLAAAPILALFAVAAAFDTLALVGYWVYLSRALTRDLARWSWIAAAIKIGCVAAGSHWGLIGVAAGYAVAPLVSWPLSLWWLARSSGVAVGDLYRGAGRIIALAVCLGLSAYASVRALSEAAALMQLAAGTTAAVTAGAVLYASLPWVRQDVAVLRSTAALMRR